MINVIVGNACHQNVIGLCAGIDAQRVARIHTGQFRKLFGNNRAPVCQRHFRSAAVQADFTLHLSILPHAKHMHVSGTCIAAFGIAYRVVAKHHRTEVRRCLAVRRKVLQFLKRHAVIRIRLNVHFPNVVELVFRNAEDGILNAKPRHQQRAASRDPDYAHEKTFFIAEYIAHGHLHGKIEAFPDKTGAFEQNTFAGLGRLGAHQCCRNFPERGCRCCNGRKAGAGHRRNNRNACNIHTIGRCKAWQAVHDRIRGDDYIRQQPKPDYRAKKAPEDAGADGINHVFHHDCSRAVPQRLERAHFDTLFLHHARHSRKAYKRCNDEKNHREHIAHRGNALRIFGIIRIAGVRGTVLNIPCAGSRFCVGFNARAYRIDQLFIRIGKGGNPFFAADYNVSLCIHCGKQAKNRQLCAEARERIAGSICKPCAVPVSNGAEAAFKNAHIFRAVYKADHTQRRRAAACFKRHIIAKSNPCFFLQLHIQRRFLVRNGQTPFLEFERVHFIFRCRVDVVGREHVDELPICFLLLNRHGKQAHVLFLIAPRTHHCIHKQPRRNRFNALDAPQCLDIIRREPGSGHHRNIRKVACVKQCIARIFHVRAGGADAGKESDPQRADCKNRKIARTRFPDFRKQVFDQKALFQHRLTIRSFPLESEFD